LAKKVERPGNWALMLLAMNAALRHERRANTADSRATEQVKYLLNQGLF
jgi:hypothetical protein